MIWSQIVVSPHGLISIETLLDSVLAGSDSKHKLHIVIVG